MRSIVGILAVLLAIGVETGAEAKGGAVHVNGYYRKDGTYVSIGDSLGM